jgi:hypothetical protein
MQEFVSLAAPEKKRHVAGSFSLERHCAETLDFPNPFVNPFKPPSVLSSPILHYLPLFPSVGKFPIKPVN